MPIRAIRGATTANANTCEAILDATRELLLAIVQANQLTVADIVSVWFTMTPDLDAAFPARAARELGWTCVALLDTQAPRIAQDVPRCIRVMMHCETERTISDLRHIYLREAKHLRSDWVEEQTR
ncbi:MAG: chorismate mutase [candidate division KSB1 bacterium]|nr:chorismate mutase [candidate division KSB1 bacterium]MDZ7272824.1 chorismate mutase [candidate division KSB1 bacterium]MDZ7284153.1 chorismate mutase [candidate division KSB1 bacterium]MDZ7297449.1 chorismate mutase [candidate division KSB1 bacterium]MDZ7305585.1 chorismate mutase [candidate division KSB1 bacterium]